MELFSDRGSTPLTSTIKSPEASLLLVIFMIKSVCPNCFGANYAATGSIYSQDDNMCRLTKIIVRARSYFKARQWQLGQLHENENDQQALLRAIVAIQEGLNV